MTENACCRTRFRHPSTGRRPGRDGGSSTAELVILTPVVVLLVLFVVGLGRFAYSRELVAQAALAAARAASLADTPSQAVDLAQAAGQASLSGAGLSCQSFTADADTGAFQAGGAVTVTVSCTANLTDTVLTGLPGHTTVTATATVPLEKFRAFSGGGR